MSIPIAEKIATESRIPFVKPSIGRDERLLFSFSAIQRDDYFNLDGTCQNWASELFLTLQKVSDITLSDVYAGKYSGKNSPLRIHSHRDVKNPCSSPVGVNVEDMWQIRISKSKGGIHGVFSENVFYVIWFDPQHNLYPDENHGGLKRVMPPSTCCKDRDEEINTLKNTITSLESEVRVYEELLNGE